MWVQVLRGLHVCRESMDHSRTAQHSLACSILQYGPPSPYLPHACALTGLRRRRRQRRRRRRWRRWTLTTTKAATMTATSA